MKYERNTIIARRRSLICTLFIGQLGAAPEVCRFKRRQKHWSLLSMMPNHTTHLHKDLTIYCWILVIGRDPPITLQSISPNLQGCHLDRILQTFLHNAICILETNSLHRAERYTMAIQLCQLLRWKLVDPSSCGQRSCDSSDFTFMSQVQAFEGQQLTKVEDH